MGMTSRPEENPENVSEKADDQPQSANGIIRCPQCGYHLKYHEEWDIEKGELEATWYECLSCGFISNA